MINIKLNEDKCLREIVYPHYGIKYISKKDFPKIKQNLKKPNLEIREIQSQYNLFYSEKQLKDEILYAQLKYISRIEIIGKVKRPREFSFNIRTINLTYDIKEKQNLQDSDEDDKASLIFEKMTVEEFGYYLSWRTKILNHEPVCYEDELISLLIKEFIYGTIDNSKDMLDYFIAVFDNHSNSFEKFYEDLKLVKYGMHAFIEEKYKKAKNEPRDLFLRRHEYYNGNYDYCQKINNQTYDICEYIRMGTGFSLSGYYYKKYNLKGVFIDIFNLAISDISSWLCNKGISFNEMFVAKKQSPKLFYEYVSQAFIFRLYNVQEPLFTYEESGEVIEFRRMLLLLIDNGIRKKANFKESEKLYHQINLCEKHLQSNDKEIILIKLVEFTNVVVEKIICSKYNSLFEYLKENQIKIEENKLKSVFSVETKKSKTPKEQFLEEVTSNCSFNTAATLYNCFTRSVKSSNRNLYYTVLFGLWILESHDDYKKFLKIIDYDKNNLISKNSLVDFESVSFLDYILDKKQVYSTRLSKKIEKDFVGTCVVLSYYLFYLVCEKKGISPSKILLGEKITTEWKIFGEYINDDLLSDKNFSVCNKIYDLEEYHVKIADGNIFAEVTHTVETKLSEIIIKNINIYIQRKLFEFYRVSTTGLLPIMDNYKEYTTSNADEIEELMKCYFDELNELLENLCIYNNTINKGDLSYILKNNSVYNLSKNTRNIELIFNIFYKTSLSQITKTFDNPILFINYNDGLNNYIFSDKKEFKYVKFLNRNWDYFYKNMSNTSHLLELIFQIEDDYDKNFDFSKYDFIDKIEINFRCILNNMRNISLDNKAFQQWILRIENGEIIIPQNKVYFYLIYSYLINGFSVTSKGYKYNLLVLTTIWNYENSIRKDLDELSIYFLELIYDYYIIYCSDIPFNEFKSLFCYEFIFEGEDKFPINTDQKADGEKKIHLDDIIRFYNDSMDYKYLQTTAKIFDSNYTSLLVKSLKFVEMRLEVLWKNYNLDFKEYLFASTNFCNNTKTLFPRIGLLSETRQWFKENNRIKHVHFKQVKVEFESLSYKTLVSYECHVINKKHNKIIKEYIFKSTEKALRNILNVHENFKLDDLSLIYEYDEKLFRDNLAKDIIYNDIKKSVYQIVKKNIDLVNVNDSIYKIDEGDNKKTRKGMNHIFERALDSINKESLEKSKKILAINQNRLIIDEEGCPIVDEFENKGNVLENINFSQIEVSILKAILDSNDKVLKDIECNGKSLTQHFEKINEKALFLIDDVIIDINSMCIFEEYSDIVQRWCRNEFE